MPRRHGDFCTPTAAEHVHEADLVVAFDADPGRVRDRRGAEMDTPPVIDAKTGSVRPGRRPAP